MITPRVGGSGGGQAGLFVGAGEGGTSEARSPPQCSQQPLRLVPEHGPEVQAGRVSQVLGPCVPPWAGPTC